MRLCRSHPRKHDALPKIHIKDIKSSSGTFVNGTRLSAEGFESEPFELKTGDIIVSSDLTTSVFVPQINCSRNSVSILSATTTEP
jgi:pSer/pThr/pTyr-binding forkhead associated (FHA) protein